MPAAVLPSLLLLLALQVQPPPPDQPKPLETSARRASNGAANVEAVVTPFWLTKPAPADWTDDEIRLLMTASPWAIRSNLGGITAFLASARPLREAEEELYRRRTLRAEVRAEEEDYRAYIQQNPGKHIVLAVPVPVTGAYLDPRELKTIEKECFVRVGKKKVKAIGHFPPTLADPFLRIVFPRVPLDGEKMLKLSVYLPSVTRPLQDFELAIKDMEYLGQLEY